MAADEFAVSVRCYGPAERAAGARTVEVVVAAPATVADVVQALADHPTAGPGLAPLLPKCAVAVGDQIVKLDHVIDPAHVADVALLPPVAGG
ncbi:MAG: MoaD/ThiS family protein [Actinobacteria bacterium]|nr:MoaD/ThiS family protein [Actinomycetota bacterium]